MSYLGAVFAAVGSVVLLVAAVGVLRLPDALSRQHAATKAATLAFGRVAWGLIVTSIASGWGWGWSLRLLVIIGVLLLTLPLASHALARSGLSESGKSTGEFS